MNEMITEEHLWWQYFREVGNHEAAATIYLADVIATIWAEYVKREDAKKKPKT